ncbi:hypothetical protein HPHPP30_0902 [Helicobacter pylori Hp P-30]|nr:hypothetical protein HPHPP30_0902 [Helicobacter pylori Hp P-30]
MKWVLGLKVLQKCFSVFLRYGIDMRLVVFFNGFNLWLLRVIIISTL